MQATRGGRNRESVADQGGRNRESVADQGHVDHHVHPLCTVELVGDVQVEGRGRKMALHIQRIVPQHLEKESRT